MRRVYRFILLGIATASIGSLAYASYALKDIDNPGVCPIMLPRTEVGRVNQLDSRTRYDCVSLQRADTPEAREKGLSGRTHMADTSGLLFDFANPQLACIWMKDMKFSIDIVWLDERQEVTAIKEKVSPDSYPESFCQDNTRYVIELAAGVAKQAGLRVGQQLKL